MAFWEYRKVGAPGAFVIIEQYGTRDHIVRTTEQGTGPLAFDSEPGVTTRRFSGATEACEAVAQIQQAALQRGYHLAKSSATMPAPVAPSPHREQRQRTVSAAAPPQRRKITLDD